MFPQFKVTELIKKIFWTEDEFIATIKTTKIQATLEKNVL